MNYTKLNKKDFDNLFHEKLQGGSVKVVERGQLHYSIIKPYEDKYLVNEVIREKIQVDAILDDKLYVLDGGYISKSIR